MLFYNNPAQDLQLLDKRLVEVYGEDQCLKWRKESPIYLDYQSFELVHGHFICNASDISINPEMEKLESIDPVNFPIDEVAYENARMFNPFRFNVRRSFLCFRVKN
jgi:hypothetical protein